jgi:hypothetical protein
MKLRVNKAFFLPAIVLITIISCIVLFAYNKNILFGSGDKIRMIDRVAIQSGGYFFKPFEKKVETPKEEKPEDKKNQESVKQSTAGSNNDIVLNSANTTPQNPAMAPMPAQGPTVKASGTTANPNPSAQLREQARPANQTVLDDGFTPRLLSDAPDINIPESTSLPKTRKSSPNGALTIDTYDISSDNAGKVDSRYVIVSSSDKKRELPFGFIKNIYWVNNDVVAITSYKFAQMTGGAWKRDISFAEEGVYLYNLKNQSYKKLIGNIQSDNNVIKAYARDGKIAVAYSTNVDLYNDKGLLIRNMYKFDPTTQESFFIGDAENTIIPNSIPIYITNTKETATRTGAASIAKVVPFN